jgi:hypothetical protein
MSLDAWIIDDLEQQRREEERQRERPGLGIGTPFETERGQPGSARSVPRRGVRILDISPDQENAIDL